MTVTLEKETVKWTLFINGKVLTTFKNVENLNRVIKHVYEKNPKTGISILNLDEDDRIVDQFIGEAWHYVED